MAAAVTGSPGRAAASSAEPGAASSASAAMSPFGRAAPAAREQALPADATGRYATATPIKHLAVIFQENVSFDHYFGTYPRALNPPGEPSFTARPGTKPVNGLTGRLLTANPNQSNPQRLHRSQALTCGLSNNYTREQVAADNGRMDQFVQGPVEGRRSPNAWQASGTPLPPAEQAPATR